MSNYHLLVYFLGLLQQTSARYLPLSLLSAVVQGVSPMVNIIIPKFIIDELLGSRNIDTLTFLIAGLAGANLILKLIEIVLNKVISIEREKIGLSIFDNLADKSLRLRYEDIEKKSILDLKERAQYGMFTFSETVDLMETANRSIISLISLVVLLFTFNAWAVLALTGITLLNSLVYKRISDLRYKDSIATIPDNRGFQFFGSLAHDFSFGKDIRLSHCADFLQGKAREYLDRILRIYSKQFNEIGKLQGITSMNMQFQSYLIYGWLAWNTFRGFISIGDLTMYGNGARHFTQALTQLVNSLVGINGLTQHIEPYKEFMALPEESEENDALEPWHLAPGATLDFKFKNVWFRYPGSENDVLKDINIEIGHHEKISIVGLNGAGKTTLIKLLCRLYQPSKGTITLNGRDIYSIPIKDYRNALSVVFQDFQLLGYSVGKNLAASMDPDQNKLDHVVDFFGIEQIIDDLPEGLETSVNRALDKEGVTFSGGQMQKFAIARALYKNSPVTILDEPTATLDPRSEYEVYRNFHKLTKGKTAIYISHRLSSTRFTDRIAVFDAGEIVELGTHEELMEKEGLYAEMYSKQAQYYL